MSERARKDAEICGRKTPKLGDMISERVSRGSEGRVRKPKNDEPKNDFSSDRDEQATGSRKKFANERRDSPFLLQKATFVTCLPRACRVFHSELLTPTTCHRLSCTCSSPWMLPAEF